MTVYEKPGMLASVTSLKVPFLQKASRQRRQWEEAHAHSPRVRCTVCVAIARRRRPALPRPPAHASCPAGGVPGCLGRVL